MADREAFDMFLGDMAAHQASHDGETTPGANQALAAPMFERFEQKRADQERRMTPAVVPDPLPPTEERLSRIEAAKRGFRFVEDSQLPADRPIEKHWSKRTVVEFRKKMARVRFLLSLHDSGPLGQPSWSLQVQAITAAAKFGTPEAKNQARVDLEALLERSNQYFGDWRAEKSKLVMVG